MRHTLAALILIGTLVPLPGIGHAANSQQDRMKDCNAQAEGMRGRPDRHSCHRVLAVRTRGAPRAKASRAAIAASRSIRPATSRLILRALASG
jgi:hypothetical protein